MTTMLHGCSADTMQAQVFCRAHFLSVPMACACAVELKLCLPGLEHPHGRQSFNQWKSGWCRRLTTVCMPTFSFGITHLVHVRLKLM